MLCIRVGTEEDSSQLNQVRFLIQWYLLTITLISIFSPGPVRTDFLRALGASEEKVDELYRVLSEKEPIGRIGEAIDVALAAAFLVSQEANFITGTILTVDGGISFV